MLDAGSCSRLHARQGYSPWQAGAAEVEAAAGAGAGAVFHAGSCKVAVAGVSRCGRELSAAYYALGTAVEFECVLRAWEVVQLQQLQQLVWC